MVNSFHIIFLPILPLSWIIFLAATGFIIVLWSFLRRAHGSLFRGLSLSLILVALYNPSLIKDERTPLKDTALIVMDESASMQIGPRQSQSKRALEAVLKNMAHYPDLETEIIRVEGTEETDLFQAIAHKLASMPRDRVAGIIAITDGEIHDKPTNMLNFPFHVLLAGQHHEIDRRITIKQAPAYGIVGKSVSITVRVDDVPKPLTDHASLILRRDDGSQEPVEVSVGKDITFDVPLGHPGVNLFAFSTDVLPNEMTAQNNTAVVSVNAVRDRLRVLLVSGQPHIGGRAWRDFLKSDPAVDLVHFTILRSNSSQDRASDKEMALIPFPVQELFDAKLKSFDLVIFDRFKNQSLVPSVYLKNIADYVLAGGALLVTNSTDAAVPVLTQSPLAQVLPAEPSGEVLTARFVPTLTEDGLRHPVTSQLPSLMPSSSWGPWFRQVGSNAVRGHVLMSGINNKPLLVLDRMGEGRVAEFMSDQFWLWSKGFEGGGPEGELLRRTVHWLMQEPELDEDALHAHVETKNGAWQLILTRQSLEGSTRHVTVTDPDGQVADVALTPDPEPGMLAGIQPVSKPGLYTVKETGREILVLVGSTNTLEYSAMQTNDAILAPYVKATQGGLFWLEDYPDSPALHRVNKGAMATGWGWIGLQRNEQYRITGSRSWPLIPEWLMISLILVFTFAAWRKEGHL